MTLQALLNGLLAAARAGDVEAADAPPAAPVDALSARGEVLPHLNICRRFATGCLGVGWAPPVGHYAACLTSS